MWLLELDVHVVAAGSKCRDICGVVEPTTTYHLGFHGTDAVKLEIPYPYERPSCQVTDVLLRLHDDVLQASASDSGFVVRYDLR